MIASTQQRRVSLPLKWHGGKHYLAQQIIDLLPSHVHYVEPYFGGGAVLFAKPQRFIEGHSEVVNDVYGDLINFWRVLQSEHKFSRFQRIVDATALGKPEWEQSRKSNNRDDVKQAVAFFIRFRQSRQGLGKDFATMSRTRTRRGMNEQVSSWLSAVDGLQEAHNRLRRVAIYCENAVDVIRREDDPHSFFYCDPPYLHETRVATSSYACEMTANQHAELLNALANMRGKFLLSGYRNALYDEVATREGWNRVDVVIDNKASGAKKKPIKIESLWSNY